MSQYATCIDDGTQILRGDRYRFTIEGHVVPYVRMTQRSKFVDKRAQQYLSWQEEARWQIRAQMQRNGWEMIPERTPFRVRCYFVPYQHRSDLDNLVKSAMDAAQGVVYPDDRWCDEIVAARATGGPERAVFDVLWPT